MNEAIEFLNLFLDNNPYCEVAWHQLGNNIFALKIIKKHSAAFDFAIISDDTFVRSLYRKRKST